jgi:type I restriction enzyme S subunit
MNENNNNIPKGYKKTKLGVIPEEWDIKKLDDIGMFSKGKGIAKKEVLNSEEEGFPCVRYAEIYTKYHYNTSEFESKIDSVSAENSNKIIQGDILFAGSGETIEDIGKSIAYLGEKIAYAGGDMIILRQSNQDSLFLGFLLNSDVSRQQLYKLGQGNSVVHIYSSGLKKLEIPLPPLPEQQKIASILSTWDKAIATQEALITQKEQLKKGLMQALLSGKKRFAGFEEEWEEIKMKDVLTIGSGKDYKHLEKGSIPVYGSGGVMTYVNKSLYSGESVGLGRKGTIDKPVFLDGEFWSVDTLFYTHSFVKCTAKYIYYLFKTIDWYRYNEASGVPSLSKNTIYSIKINLPPIEEQQKIADTLSSADKEIENLKTQLATMKLQKQGLMQELLTGKRRVKLN